jgi:hypothetical protein
MLPSKNKQMPNKLIVIASLSFLAPLPIMASTFDAATDFSANNNPNSVWSYGWSETLGSTFHFYPDIAKDPFGNDVWYQPGYNQFVVHNGTETVTSIWQVGQLGFGPGQNNAYSIIRWTAPTTETYNVTANFVGAGNATTDVHVLKNGHLLFQGDINGFGSSAQLLPIQIAINAGDTIDFTVGWGTNGNINFDNTGFSATISSVPIPGAVWLFGAGLAGLMSSKITTKQ